VRTKQNTELQAKEAGLQLEIEGLKASVKSKETALLEKSLENQRINAYARSLRQVLCM
jgi:hypothetical protein